MNTDVGTPPGVALPGAVLRSGARIAFDGGLRALRDRVRLSSGTRPASGNAALAPYYGEDALVPRAPWRPLSDTEAAALFADRAGERPPWRPGADAALIRIPDRLILPLTEMLDRHRIRDRGDTTVFQANIAGDPSWSENLMTLRGYFTSFTQEKMGALPLMIGPPGHYTLTKDVFGADIQKFIGLHLDSWDKLPLRHRHRSRNRICINLGREARYALFINLPLLEMFSSLGLRDPEDIYADFRGLHLGQRFMRSCPTYPVVRLRIEPGEAYLLPTDNLIHDGSTAGTTHPDVTMTFIGRFTPPGAVEAP